MSLTRDPLPPRRRRARLVAVAAAVSGVLTVGACSGDSAVEVADEMTAPELLENARDALVDAGTVRLGLTSADLPDGGGAVISGDGVGQLEPPAFEGSITARIAGIQADVPVIAVDGDLHVQLPYTSSYVNQSPDQLGVPDPATLFDPELGVVTLLTLTDDATYGEQTRVREEVLQQVSGTVPADAVARIFGTAESEGTFDAVYGILDDETPEVRTVTLTGEFYPPQTSTYTLNLSDYGLDVDIAAP